MSEYEVYCSHGSIRVLKAGKPIHMLKLLELAEPAFSCGDDSDGSRNLAYAILSDFAGDLYAQSWCEDFMFQFVTHERRLTWSITTMQIDKYIALLSQAKLLAQKPINKLETI